MTAAARVGRLHVLTDESLQDRLTHVELAVAARDGGADVVQYREKRLRSTRELVETAAALRRALAGSSATLLIDDRADVAAAVGAAGVHLGRHDLAPVAARRLLGAEAVIGGTANGLEEALAVARGPVDYLGVGPVFGTRTKENPPPELGVEGLRAIASAVDLPVIAIGNIAPERVGEVIAAGAHGVAVISAVVLDPDPERAVRRFRDALAAAIGASASCGP